MTCHPYNFCHLDLVNFCCNIFTPEEKKRLSVAKISFATLLNDAGKPIPGGLYDPALGPFDLDSDTCQTCGNSYVNCAGHLGHIELCTLVYNRIFGRAIYSVLRMSCLSCFRLQFSDDTLKILRLQLELIEKGYVREPQELEIFKTTPDIDMLADFSAEKKKKITEYKNLLKKEQSGEAHNTKTTEELRLSIINAIIQSKGKSRKCIHCPNQLYSFKYSNNRLVRSVPKGELENAFGTDSTKSAYEPILPEKCRDILRNIYHKNKDMLNLLFPSFKTHSSLEEPVDLCFTDIVLVTPPNTRPHHKIDNGSNRTTGHHHQTGMYIKIIEANTALKEIMSVRNSNSSAAAKELMSLVAGNTSQEKELNAWQELQTCIDQTWDINMGKDKGGQGLKQIIEKKEGIIRTNMLGKRVNHAGRTVITPDPYINIDEIGIPEIFAKKLTYPVPVTEWNAEDLRKYVTNGPDIYPGANFIEEGLVNKMIQGDKPFDKQANQRKRESMAKTLLVSSVPKVVHRHLLNGDILLLNRQPSLHRPSIMAHKVRVMKHEKTLRLHYSNCKSYNADFDGDEMNCHCPQNEVARSEAYNLVNVANHFLVPKDGTPLGGLIQDHVVAGVKMTMRGRFFNREDYQQLVFVALSHLKRDIDILPPAIMKPKKLWSGKQILSTVIRNLIPKQKDNSKGINMNSTAKITAKAWQVDEPRDMLAGGSPLKDNEMTEAEVIIRGGDILVGVLDKTHFGATPHGLIHCMYEIYGGACSTQLLSSFSKLFTFFLQREGFSLGVHDILVVNEANDKRYEIIRKIQKTGKKAAAIALDLPANTSPSELAEKIEEEYNRNPLFRTILDRQYKVALDRYSNKMNKACVPAGLLSKFPDNNLQLMVASGAKGSSVNTIQISSALGQMELEGKRPPLMISGRSLPSFIPFETSPKSGGFIVGRYLTGISPQEFFFHCMAGREGLIDTAVKTSRSGYLQRCLVKHLEGLNVHYDMTVRDSDNCVVQFLYGEDGMDILKAPFLYSKHFSFLDANVKLINRLKIDEDVEHYKKKLRHWLKKHPDNKLRNSLLKYVSKDQTAGTAALTQLWNNLDHIVKAKYKKKNVKCPDPTISCYQPDNYLGAISERLEKLVDSYCKNKPSNNPDIMADFKTMMYEKSMMSLVAPGEPVGLLAAQSIGEPSTQMTLNTFHFAGRGEMNVTLGIPRLKEILMTASKNLKTPFMDIPFKANIQDQLDIVEKIRLKMIRVTLFDVLESINVTFSVSLKPKRVKECVFRFNFLHRDLYRDEYYVKPKQIREYVERKFFKLMFKAIEKSSQLKSRMVDNKKETSRNNEEDDDDDNAESKNEKTTFKNDSGSEQSENENEDGDAATTKKKNQKADQFDYDEKSEDESMDELGEHDDVKYNVENEGENNDIEDDEALLDYQKTKYNVLSSYNNVRGYEFDKKRNLWCELTFDLPVTNKNIDFSTLLREVAKSAVIHEVKGIKRAITHPKDKSLMLKTDGINLTEMFKYNEYLDLSRLYTNDIHTVASTYGIEAASRVVVHEIQELFSVYGITVDPRHLLLIADYMTFTGTFKPLSREGMKYSASSLQRMSFEAPIQTLQAATIYNTFDELESPASRIMVGKPCKGGTGIFSLIFKNTTMQK